MGEVADIKEQIISAQRKSGNSHCEDGVQLGPGPGLQVQAEHIQPSSILQPTRRVEASSQHVCPPIGAFEHTHHPATDVASGPQHGTGVVASGPRGLTLLMKTQSKPFRCPPPAASSLSKCEGGEGGSADVSPESLAWSTSRRLRQTRRPRCSSPSTETSCSQWMTGRGVKRATRSVETPDSASVKDHPEASGAAGPERTTLSPDSVHDWRQYSRCFCATLKPEAVRSGAHPGPFFHSEAGRRCVL